MALVLVQDGFTTLFCYQLLFILASLFRGSIAIGCGDPYPQFGIESQLRAVTVMVKSYEPWTVNVTCMINCTDITWRGCGIEQDAFVVVPSDQYSTHRVCPSHIDFNNEFNEHGVVATCNRSGISDDFCNNMEFARYNATLKFNGLSPLEYKEFVVICGFTPKADIQNICQPIESASQIGLGSIYIISIKDIEIRSDQIDHHPAINAQEGDNVTITCARTPGTDAKWKFAIDRLDGTVPLELLYPGSSSELEQQGFNVYTEDSNLSDNSMQNFSITIVCVLAKMTGIEIFCGATAEGTGPGEHQKFHDRGSVLVVHKNGIPPTCVHGVDPDATDSFASHTSVPSTAVKIAVPIGSLVACAVLFVFLLVFVKRSRKVNLKISPTKDE